MTTRYNPEDAAGHRVKQPQGHDASHRRGTGRAAEYMAVTWSASNCATRSSATELRWQRPGKQRTQTRTPQPDLEAEP